MKHQTTHEFWRRWRLVVAGCVLLSLVACVPGIARTTDWTFTHDGKTYVIQGFKFRNTQNLTLYDDTSGSREYVGVVEGVSLLQALNDPDLPDTGHLQKMRMIVAEGEQQGKPVSTEQNSVGQIGDAPGTFIDDFETQRGE